MDKQEILKDEILMIEHSGEMPEVSFYESLHFLTDDPEGPEINLEFRDKLFMKQAVIRRYMFIILRDLNPKNRNKTIYRGLKRSIINWQRLKKYARKEGLEIEEVRQKTAGALTSFLEREWKDVMEKGEESCLNCSRQELAEFAGDLGLDKDELIKKGWEFLCPS
ncbi:MAG: hypothetical protein ACLFV2_00755 [Desulfurivibrionaceae bacterium]